ncbi:MAG: hypothetical protein QW794_04365 [Thermosphaera sp.]
MCEPPDPGSVCCSDECIAKFVANLYVVLVVAWLLIPSAFVMYIYLNRAFPVLSACFGLGAQSLHNPECTLHFGFTAVPVAFLAFSVIYLIAALKARKHVYEQYKW